MLRRHGLDALGVVRLFKFGCVRARVRSSGPVSEC
jgi:hypothetical protein